MSAQITIICSTYDRPDALKTAIAGVRAQTRPDWRLLVIGDQCGPETGAAVAGFEDRRIAYINLPERCGEQAGPNSVGMALADTPHIAFLNHDDVWLPDHLALGLAALKSQQADFFIGRAAFAAPHPDIQGRLAFIEASALDRRLDEAFDHFAARFEPASAWLLTRHAAQRVGPWRPAATLYRPPVADWLLRAWRAGLNLVCGETVSVIKPRLLKAGEGGRGAYAESFDDFERWRDLLKTPAALSELIEADLRRFGWREAGPRFNPDTPSRLVQVLAAGLDAEAKAHFLATGEDRADSLQAELGVRPGHGLRHALKLRTLEDLPEPPDFEALVEHARRELRSVLNEG